MFEWLERLLNRVDSRVFDEAEARLVVVRKEDIVCRNGQIRQVDMEETVGYSLRLLKDGSWGFAGTNRLDEKEIDRTWKNAEEMLAFASKYSPGVRLSPLPPVVGEWRAPIAIDPFDVDTASKIGLLLEADRAMARTPDIVTRMGELHFVRVEQWFMNLSGSRLYQCRYYTGAGITVVASRVNDIQIRSYPFSNGGQWDGRGYEAVQAYNLPENGSRIAEEAIALLSAPPCPEGRFDVVIGSAQMALQVHESCGHPTEFDRTLGWEVNMAGRTFLQPRMLNTFEYGSPAVNIVADATPSSGLGCGTFAWDDEGVPASCVPLIEHGVFRGFMTSRETAHYLGLEKSSGCARGEHGHAWPLIRMTNVNLQPGSGTLEDLLEALEDGYYLEMNRSWSIDDARLNFQFGTEIGWRVQGGKLRYIIRDPVYRGRTPEFWRSCVRVGGPETWFLYGVPNCGKGQPVQTVPVGHGTAPALFRQISLSPAKNP